MYTRRELRQGLDCNLLSLGKLHVVCRTTREFLSSKTAPPPVERVELEMRELALGSERAWASPFVQT